MKPKTRQFMVAKSGEVFFTEDGILKRMDSMEGYQEMVKEEERVSKLYFEITVGEGNNKTYYKLQLVNRDMVFQVLNEIRDMDTRIKEQTRYFQEREANGL